jgi:hypothetical protein
MGNEIVLMQEKVARRKYLSTSSAFKLLHAQRGNDKKRRKREIENRNQSLNYLPEEHGN